MHGYDSAEELLTEITNAAVQLFVDPQQMMEVTAATARDGIVRGAEIELYRKDRSRFWVMVNLRAVHDRTGKIVTFEGTAEDITNRKAAEAQVNYLAYHDALTGLPNRTLFMDRLENALAGARRKNEKLAVLFLDLDRFKNINDSLGHSFGDQMLKVVAERLRECVREQDTVARVGGDEFLILLSEMEHEAEPALAARRILNAMGRTFVVHGRSMSTSCSVGVSMFPEHGADGETLIKNADAAMYCAKDDGIGKVRVFESAMNSATVAELTLENDLRTALEAGEFFLEYQPQMEIATGRITGDRGAASLAAPGAGTGAAGSIHPDRGEQRIDSAHRRVGGEGGVRSGEGMAGRWSGGGAGIGECVGAAVSAGRFLRSDP